MIPKKPDIYLQIKNQTGSNIRNLLLFAVFILITMPLWTIFQDVITKAVMRFGWYKIIQGLVVPYQLAVTSRLLNIINIPNSTGPDYFELMISGQNQIIHLAWNCVGWQTFVALVITLISGLSGKYRLVTKLETLMIGLLGTYLLNIIRLLLVVIAYHVTGRNFGSIFHTYFSNLLTLAWLFYFWWFAYKYILEEKRA